jgi:hypothetical protein
VRAYLSGILAADYYGRLDTIGTVPPGDCGVADIHFAMLQPLLRVGTIFS